MIEFTKMHGTGNDFVLVRAAALAPFHGEALASFVRAVCDRHFGIGADGLLAYEGDGRPHLRMHYWNADGSRAAMCGNGARCLVRLAVDRGEAAARLQLATDAGTHEATVQALASGTRVEIDMGVPRWQPAEVPVRAAAPLVDHELPVAGTTLRITTLSMGNPHAIVFVTSRRDWEELDFARFGRALAEHEVFPEQANASFVHVGDGSLELHTWERGVGPTLACGTASCAALAAARRLGHLQSSSSKVRVPGGTVHVRADTQDHLWLSGNAEYVADGRLAPDFLRAFTNARGAGIP